MTWDDEPFVRHTDIGGGYTLIEEDGLCVIEPDPFEQQLDAYYAEQERQHDEFMEQLDRRAFVFSMPCHDHTDYKRVGSCGHRPVWNSGRTLKSARFGRINLRVYRFGFTELETWIDTTFYDWVPG